jgi:ribonucleoside-diphosphate reductase alpha chain
LSDSEAVGVEVVAPNETGEMTAEDFAAMVEQARAAAANGGDDCEMCGS